MLLHHLPTTVPASARAERAFLPGEPAVVYLSFGDDSCGTFVTMTATEARAIAASLQAAATQAEALDADAPVALPRAMGPTL